MNKGSLAVVLGLLLCGCATSGKSLLEASTAQVSISSSFDYREGMRVAVFPFTVTGNPDLQKDIVAADIFCLKLREAGFTIIDSTIFQGHDLQLSGLIPKGDLAAIRQALHVDLVVFGSIKYSYYPGLRGLISKGYFAPDMASVRFVDVPTGEVVVIAGTESSSRSMVAEMGEAVKQLIRRGE